MLPRVVGWGSYVRINETIARLGNAAVSLEIRSKLEKAFEVNETAADENRFFLKLGNSRGLNLLGNAFERGIENKFGKCDFETPVEDGSLFEIEGFLGRAF